MALSLLLSLVLSAYLFAYGQTGPISLIRGDSVDSGFISLIPFSAPAWLIILSIPTLIGAAALFNASKFGIYISLGILPIMAFSLGMSVFFALGYSQGELVTKILVDLSIASVMSMLGILILGWKRMRWKVAHKVRPNLLQQSTKQTSNA